ncbi:MAG: hypothetical protein EPN72_12280 [Nevskiaceae bacterium]|nr:MAG: hypothetical protein EPN63_00695 [Nevskiaceae bacterium]TBR71953.1 MAG: hypothetical protein EPN72_12280 [Nevskiaceae bacterium]
MLKQVQKQWFGHGILMLLAALIGGVGLWMFLLGGFEIVPGYMLHFQLPGSVEGWHRIHAAPVMNGLMVIGVALVLPALDFSERAAKIMGWLIVADGWGNVIFYWFENFMPNRSLSFGPNQFGPGSWWNVIGLGPAYVFGAIAIVVFAIIGWRGIHAISGKGTGEA